MENNLWSQLVLPAQVRANLWNAWCTVRDLSRKEVGKSQPFNILISGAPGTGKSEITKAFGFIEGVHLLRVNGMDLRGRMLGESTKRVQDIFNKARNLAPAVLSIDLEQGPYSDFCVFPRQGSLKDGMPDEIDSVTKEIMFETMVQMEAVKNVAPIFLLGETFNTNRVDRAILRRFQVTIEIPLPNEDERVEILRLEMRKLEFDRDLPAFIGPATQNFSGRALANMTRDVYALALERRERTPALWREVLARHGRSLIVPSQEDVRPVTSTLPSGVIKELQNLCQFLRSLPMRRDRPMPRVLLHGSSPTDKTQIARLLANECQLALIAVGPSDIRGALIGQSAFKIRELFTKACMREPCILFIDAIESVAPALNDPDADHVTAEMLTELLVQLNEITRRPRDITFVAGSSHLERINSNLLLSFTARIDIS